MPPRALAVGPTVLAGLRGSHPVAFAVGKGSNPWHSAVPAMGVPATADKLTCRASEQLQTELTCFAPFPGREPGKAVRGAMVTDMQGARESMQMANAMLQR